MFRSTSSLLTAALLSIGGARAAPAAGSAATFEVGGTLEPADRGLAVRVSLQNRGSSGASDVRLFGELLGERASAELPTMVAAGTGVEATLRFADVVPTAGVHGLLIRLEYQTLDAGRETVMTQYAYLLLGFGASTAPRLRVTVPPVRLSETGTIPITVESLDGRPHRVRLALYAPRTLGAVPHRQIVDVPARGAAHASARLFRSMAPDHSRHGLLAMAVTDGEEGTSTAAASAVIEVGADPAWLPRLRVRLLLVAAAFALLAAALREQRRAATA